MATSEIWSKCEAILANTAETINLDYVNSLTITNKSGADLFVKFGWASADTEVSASNFDICIGDDETFSKVAETPTFPRVGNMRVISTSGGYVAAIGW